MARKQSPKPQKTTAKPKAKPKSQRPKRETNETPTPEVVDISWHERFLDVYKISLNVSLAAMGAGVGRATVYRHLTELPKFAEAFQDAKGHAIDRLEAAAYKRAEASSDKLLIFMLRAHKPETYADHLHLTLGSRRSLEHV